MSSDELARIDAAAKAARLTRAAYIRKTLLGTSETSSRSEKTVGQIDADQREMIRQLSRIGSNLNQLARSKNSGDPVDPVRIADALSEVTEAVKRVAR